MYTIKQAAQYLGVSPITLRKWDRSGKLIAVRTYGNHRRYSLETLQKVYGVYDSDYDISIGTESPKHIVVYSRVSSIKQSKEGNLDRQAEHLTAYARSHFPPNVHIITIKEYGSGLNASRRGLTRVLNAIENHLVSHLVVAYPDRLTRFGYVFLERFCSVFGVKIILVDPVPQTNIDQQLVEDMMALLACFSGKLYARRTQIQQNKTKNREEFAFIQAVSKAIHYSEDIVLKQLQKKRAFKVSNKLLAPNGGNGPIVKILKNNKSRHKSSH